jgi:thiosulfate/3-mercaptopyruvate sulfurtransferase
VKRIIAGNETGTMVLDARSKARFDGIAPEPRPGLPSGHMPGAVSLPFTELLAADGTMKDPAALRAIFAARGADGARRMVTSCGTGVTACVLALGALRAGLPEPAVYDGSWTEWASRPETPKATA